MTTTITEARSTINMVDGRRLLIRDRCGIKYCIAIIKNSDTKEYEAGWMDIDITNRSIKCTRGEGENERVMGFYPMTAKGYKQAHHDIREYAWYSKNS